MLTDAHVSVVVSGDPTASAQQQQRETIESVIRGQRRMKGTIVSVEAGKCRVIGELGEFPFSLSSVKENKRFPGRTPKPGDRCDFKLSDTNPVKATSIRVIVPKTELAAGGGDGDGADEPTSTEAFTPSHRGGSASCVPISAATQAASSSPASGLGGLSRSISVSCMTASSSLEGGSGIEDLCSGLQRMGTESCSLFSN